MADQRIFIGTDNLSGGGESGFSHLQRVYSSEGITSHLSDILGYGDPEGHPIYYSFNKPHEGLNGTTPAEKAGIKLEGHDKRLTIIQKDKIAEENK